MQKILCPYCSRTFDASEAQYQCENNEKNADGVEQCPSVEDELLADYWGVKGVLHKRFFSGRVLKRKLFVGPKKVQPCVCPTCQQPSTRIVCPHCHNPLPADFIEEGSEIISIIGDRSSGKTVYFLSLIDQLRKNGYRVHIHQTTPSDVSYDESTRTSLVYEKQSRELFQESILPDQNRAVRPTPMLFKISSRRKEENKGRTIYLVFYDTAGEIFRDANKIDSLARYLKDSAGIILLMDPFTTAGLQDVLVEGGIIPERTKATVDPIVLFDRLDQIRGREKVLHKPIALTYSKIDAVVKALEKMGNPYRIAGIDLKSDSSFLLTGELKLDEVDAINDGLRTAAEKWGNGNLIEFATRLFGKENVRMFAVSALGCNPDARGKIPNLKPYRVMDPLVWILHKLGGFDIPVVE